MKGLDDLSRMAFQWAGWNYNKDPRIVQLMIHAPVLAIAGKKSATASK